MTGSKVIFCTGGNRGLGYAIIEVAGLRDPSSTYILTARDPEAGERAAATLRQTGVRSKIRVLELDVTNDHDIAAAVKTVELDYGKLDGLDRSAPHRALKEGNFKLTVYHVVLINNSGILLKPQDHSLASLRDTYNTLLNVNLTSVAVITTAFIPLLHKAANPKVINITSGLGSITNALSKKMGRSAAYGGSKIGMNGVTMHMQAIENDRLAEAGEIASKANVDGYIKYYVVQPGVLKTDFAKHVSPRAATVGIDAREGAEAVVRLMMDENNVYEAGTYWEYVDGEMKQVPW